MADIGCRNTVFGAEAQEASLHLESWRQAGIVHFRLEFVHETGAEVARLSGLVAEALAGRKSFGQLTKDLKRAAPQGTTEGSLFVPKDYLVLPILQ
jgi:putative protease